MRAAQSLGNSTRSISRRTTNRRFHCNHALPLPNCLDEHVSRRAVFNVNDILKDLGAASAQQLGGKRGNLTIRARFLALPKRTAPNLKPRDARC